MQAAGGHPPAFAGHRRCSRAHGLVDPLCPGLGGCLPRLVFLLISAISSIKPASQ
ncbi:hypothetical protein ACP4OV_022816 [Aristida adscensionis]